MKQTIFAALALCSIAPFAQAQKGYSITGKIKGLPDGTSFFLVRNKEGKADTIARTKSSKEQFVLTGKQLAEGEFHFVKLDTSAVKLAEGKKKSYATLLLDHSAITLTGDMTQWPDVTIAGSKPTDEYNAYVEKFTTINNDFNKAMAAAANNKEAKETAEKSYRGAIMDYINAHADSYLSPNIIIRSAKILGKDFVKAGYDKLTTRAKNSYYGQDLKKAMTVLLMRDELAKGKAIPNFSVETPEGKMVSIQEVAKQSKYTLIDFWAYWCKPCRNDIPNMKKAYDTFHDKGFNILSITVDRNKNAWKKAMTEEDAPWSHGMELNEESKALFDVAGIPSYILLNSKGELVAASISNFGASGPATAYEIDGKQKTLRGDDLHEVLGDLLGKK